MAKKDKKQVIVMTPDNSEVRVEDEPMFESEAYTAPQPEAGSDVTVLKPVGTGGPVPIVAPKHNTIQLQPIVVPLAVVPYMTQDSNILRTDGRGQSGYVQSSVESDEATDFETIAARKVRKRVKVQPRIFALVTFLLSALVLLPFVLSYFKANVGNLSIEQFNVIGAIMGWVANGFKLHRRCGRKRSARSDFFDRHRNRQISSRAEFDILSCGSGSDARIVDKMDRITHFRCKTTNRIPRCFVARASQFRIDSRLCDIDEQTRRQG